MNKVMRLGTVECGNRTNSRLVTGCSLFARVTYKEDNDNKRKLSIVGVVGPLSNGDCLGSAGQIRPTEEIFIGYAPGWDAEKVAEFSRLWDRWHLNDMRAGCEHQQAKWNPSEVLELTPLAWGDAFHRMRKEAEEGIMPPDAYKTWAETRELVHQLTIAHKAPKHPALWGAEGEKAIAAGLVRIDEKKKENKSAGWVYPEEHPRGLLGKPCEVCGYKYGSTWLYEEVPADVIAWIESLPDADRTPAWV